MHGIFDIHISNVGSCLLSPAAEEAILFNFIIIHLENRPLPPPAGGGGGSLISLF